MLHQRGWIVVLLGYVFAGAVCGCGGGKGFKTAGVDGVVTYKGEPLANHLVKLVSSSGAIAVGKTNDEGEFEIAEGVPVGKCTVMVAASSEAMNFDGIDATTMAKPQNAEEAREFQAAMRKMSSERKEKRNQEQQAAKKKNDGVPPKFASPKSGLEVTVSAKRAENKFTFDIND